MTAVSPVAPANSRITPAASAARPASSESSVSPASGASMRLAKPGHRAVRAYREIAVGDVVGAGEFDDAHDVVHPFLDAEERGEAGQFVGVGGDAGVGGLEERRLRPVLVDHLDDGGEAEAEGEFLDKAAADPVDGSDPGAERADGVGGVARDSRRPRARSRSSSAALTVKVVATIGAGSRPLTISSSILPVSVCVLPVPADAVTMSTGCRSVVGHGHSSPQMPPNSQRSQFGGARRYGSSNFSRSLSPRARRPIGRCRVPCRR